MTQNKKKNISVPAMGGWAKINIPTFGKSPSFGPTRPGLEESKRPSF